jgi:hypothetical protein
VKSEFLALKGYYIVVVLTILLIFVNEYSIGQIILAGDYNDILSKIETKKYINQRNLINQSIT